MMSSMFLIIIIALKAIQGFSLQRSPRLFALSTIRMDFSKLFSSPTDSILLAFKTIYKVDEIGAENFLKVVLYNILVLCSNFTLLL